MPLFVKSGGRYAAQTRPSADVRSESIEPGLMIPTQAAVHQAKRARLAPHCPTHPGRRFAEARCASRPAAGADANNIEPIDCGTANFSGRAAEIVPTVNCVLLYQALSEQIAMRLGGRDTCRSREAPERLRILKLRKYLQQTSCDLNRLNSDLLLVSPAQNFHPRSLRSCPAARPTPSGSSTEL